MKKIIVNEGIIASQIILTLLECNVRLEEALDTHKASISIGALQNCREQGFTYSTISKNSNIFTWCTYVHRNTDSIVLNGKKGYCCYCGELPYSDDHEKFFRYNDFDKVAETLANEIINFLTKK